MSWREFGQSTLINEQCSRSPYRPPFTVFFWPLYVADLTSEVQLSPRYQLSRTYVALLTSCLLGELVLHGDRTE